jgi:hypothetical protein
MILDKPGFSGVPRNQISVPKADSHGVCGNGSELLLG